MKITIGQETATVQAHLFDESIINIITHQGSMIQLTAKRDHRPAWIMNQWQRGWKVTNAMNGYGQNTREEYKDVEVIIEKADRKGHPRIDINKPQDLLCIMEEMMDEWLEHLFYNQRWATEDIKDDSSNIDTDQYAFTYTQPAMEMINRYKARLEKVFNKHFPDEQFEIDPMWLKQD